MLIAFGIALYTFFLKPAAEEAVLQSIDTESVAEIESDLDTTTKIQDFVLSKVPDSEVFLKFHLEDEEHHEVSQEEMKKGAVEMFYAAIIKENIDYLNSAVTVETFQSIWGEEMDFGKREQHLKDYLQQLYRNGQLTGIKYKVQTGQFDVETNEGAIQLTYEDGSTIDIPFMFVGIGEGHEEMFQLELTNVLK